LKTPQVGEIISLIPRTSRRKKTLKEWRKNAKSAHEAESLRPNCMGQGVNCSMSADMRPNRLWCLGKNGGFGEKS